MFISIPKKYDRYSFIIGDNPLDDKGASFSSLRDSYLVYGLPSSYESFGEAHAFATRLKENVPSAILAKRVNHYKRFAKLEAEDEVVDHFYEQIALLQERLSSIISEKPEDKDDLLETFISEIQNVKESAKSIREELTSKENDKELKDIIRKIKDLESKAKRSTSSREKKASAVNKPHRLAKDVIRAFGEAALKAVSCSHPEAFIKGMDYDPDTQGYDVAIAEDDGDICIVKFNNDMLLTGIAPCSKISKDALYHQSSFYTQYWEPVVAAIGHVFLPHCKAIALPFYGESSRFEMNGFKVGDCTPLTISVSCDPDGKGPWWINAKSKEVIKKASNFTEEEMENAEVRCTRRDLPTYYNRTGGVVSVTQRADYADVTVDFRRGLGLLVLKDSDIELVQLPS